MQLLYVRERTCILFVYQRLAAHSRANLNQPSLCLCSFDVGRL